MLKHKIYVKRQRQGLGEKNITSLCRRVIKATLYEERVDIPCEVSVLVTDDKGIREINRQHRDVDKATDVLSFPLQNYIPGDFRANIEDIAKDTGNLHLGDIVISAPRAEAQAAQYGHMVSREIAYLIVHATLHLLGYDHVADEEARKIMREREEIILRKLSLLR